MKKLVVELNTKSIEQTINYLKHVRKNIAKMMDELLEFACEWIIKKANTYIENADLGALVKLELKNSWGYTIDKGVAKVSNTAVMVKHRRVRGADGKTQIVDEKVPTAVLVEFGVGVVGEDQPHPNAIAEGYEYNIPTKHKSADGTWYFWTNNNDLDLPLSAVQDIRGHDDFRGEHGKRIVVGTRGAKGVMYAYNAIVYAQMDLQNPNGDFAKEWAKIKERYLV